MDVAFLHSNGFNITVGTLGSSFSIFQASILGRYCSEVYILFDGDDAGRRASQRVMDIYKEKDLKLYDIKYILVNLPDNYDPDSYIMKYGINKFKELLNSSKKNNW